MAKKKQPANAVDAKNASPTHETPLQQKLKNKAWDPFKENLEILNEYEEGTPKREGGKDYWGACCLESQDVDVVQKPKQTKKR